MLAVSIMLYYAFQYHKYYAMNFYIRQTYYITITQTTMFFLCFRWALA